MPRRRVIKPVLPSQTGRDGDLAWNLWLPPAPAPPRGGILVLHGAGSCKESHHDFARAAVAGGVAVLGFDQRGHGGSGGMLGASVLDDLVAMATRLRAALPQGSPLALRGSSMGGYLALLAAEHCDARAVVAVCPASAAGLRRGLASGRLDFPADRSALDAFLAEHDLAVAVSALRIPVLILHAEGDEQVPVDHSRELANRFRNAASRLIVVPGGHHRSVQHDPELQALSLRFLERVLWPRPPAE